jgi:polar amino acid transport system substrate-binding protein
MPFRSFAVRALSLIALLLSFSANADVLSDILKNNTIRFGVAEFVPWTMKSESGELIGFEIDLAKKIATDMGVEAEFVVYPWDKIIAALQRGDIDVLAGGMAITPGRALLVNFTQPLAESGVSLATNTAMTQHINRLDELNSPDIIITVVRDTLAHNVSELLFKRAEVKVFDETGPAEEEVIEGRAHVYLASTVEARFLSLRHPDKVDFPVEEPLLGSSEGLAVRKGEQELLNFLNSWIVARQSDKWIATTHDYWFDTLDWAPKVAK